MSEGQIADLRTSGIESGLRNCLYSDGERSFIFWLSALFKKQNLPADKYPYVPVKVSAGIYPEKYDEILLN